MFSREETEGTKTPAPVLQRCWTPLLPHPGAVLPAARIGHAKGLPPISLPELLHIFLHKCPHGVQHCLEIWAYFKALEGVNDECFAPQPLPLLAQAPVLWKDRASHICPAVCPSQTLVERPWATCAPGSSAVADVVPGRLRRSDSGEKPGSTI